MGVRYEVLSITTGGEAVIESHADMDAAFDACVKRWATRKTGSAVYAVRDGETEQRWSYRDIQGLQAEAEFIKEQQLEELRRDEQRREDNRRWERENAK